MVHAVMYSYYFASIFIKDLDKVADVKKSITIMQMVSAHSKAFAFRWHWRSVKLNKLIRLPHTRNHYASQL